jgi:hypothetical protein
MADNSIAIVAIISAVGALAVSVLRYVRHSECWCFKVDTRTPPPTPLSKPQPASLTQSPPPSPTPPVKEIAV